VFDFINTVLGVPLGFILRAFYSLTGHFGIAVLIFAIVVRVIMFPVNYAAHMNAIRFLRLQPALYRLKKQFSVDRESLNAAQYELFKEEKYRPLLGLVPLLLQLFLLIGVLQVMYRPLQHVLGYNAATISELLYGIPSGPAAQITAAAGVIDMNFLGINIGLTPSFAHPVLMLIPLLSGLTALAFCLFQNAYSPGALPQSRKTNMVMTLLTVAFSVYFAWVLPASVGIYWIIGNILGVAVTLLLEALFSPRKLAPEAYEHILSTKKMKSEVKAEREQTKRLTARARKDISQFNAAKKELVFYALSSGQYKYYKNTIDYIVNNSDIVIHYLTNDPNDNIFVHDRHERLMPYYAGERETIALMLRLDTKMLVTTVQDLQTYHMKRSIARLDIEYIHIPHGPASLHLTARETAYDHFDTFFCVGEHQAAEIRRREEMAGLHKKRLVKAGYGLYDQLREQCKHMEKTTDIPQILIAPSWQPENILDTCIKELLSGLLDNNWRIIVRPHPQHLKVFPEIIDELEETYQSHIKSGELILDTDFLSNATIFTSDVLITDWSGIAFEFSLATSRPSIFINTPMKVLNPNYKDYGLEVTDISLRDKIGVSVELSDVENIGNITSNLLDERDSYAQRIEEVSKAHIYYHGRSGEAGGRYIINRLRG